MIEFKNITIEFPGVRALDNVSFTIEKGETVGLCGENGAGKSTLGKILAGVHSSTAYEGEIIYKESKLTSSTTRDAEKKGIAIVHQELNLFNELTVAENIFINDLPRSRGKIDFELLNEKARDILKRINLDIDPRRKVKELSVSTQQMIEIAKVLMKNPEVIIFDEATSSISNTEVDVLFRIIKSLKQQNVTMIYVSHKLDEIFEICDSIAVLKDGKYVNSAKIQDITREGIIEWMVGRELKNLYPEKPKKETKKERVVFAVKDWTVFDQQNRGRKRVDQVSFELREGEILGIYGLVGAGRTELVNSIFEGKEIPSTGIMQLHGKVLNIKNPVHAIEKGLALVTEDRKKSGLFFDLSVADNISISSNSKTANKFGFINEEATVENIESMIKRLKVKVPNRHHKVKNLSGGNQQKVIIGKWLLTKPKILILDEPTRGVDVGAKSEIYNIIQQLANEGMSIIMVSSELPEILGVSDRIIVLNDGVLTGEVTREEATEENLAKLALGGGDNGKS